MIGDYGYLYGNDDKMDEASARAKILFSEEDGSSPQNPSLYAKLDFNNVFTKAQRGEIAHVAYESPLSFDMNISNKLYMRLLGDVSIIAVTNAIASQNGMIYIQQDEVGNHDITWDSSFKFFGASDESLVPNDINAYRYEIFDESNILIELIGSF